MRWQCPKCGPDVPYGDDKPLCPTHFLELDPYQPEPAWIDDEEDDAKNSTAQAKPGEAPTSSSTAVRWDRSRCWHCTAEPPDPRNTECLACHRPLTPPVLLLRFHQDEIEVNPGMRVELGRIGEHGRAFRSYPNVSRRHAVVGVDPDGEPWIQPLLTPNGTFIDGSEIPASVRQPLRNGQRLRFALHAEGTATVYAR
jgi:hypothetical protein